MNDTISEWHQSQYGFFGDSISVEKHFFWIASASAYSYVERVNTW
jgi:hypothetical protein